MCTAGSAMGAPVPGIPTAVVGTGTARAGCRHPLVVCALQREASITEMSLLTVFAVYRVWVRLSSTTP